MTGQLSVQEAVNILSLTAFQKGGIRGDMSSRPLSHCMSPICHVTPHRHVLHRRGAAFGLAGMIKGLGISAINRYGTMDALKKALNDQTSADAREGALFAFECLCEKLGR